MREDSAALLKRFEPILRFTQGEQFFPFDVARYVEGSSLWVHRRGLGDERVVDEGELSLQNLGDRVPQAFDSVHYLKFIEPLNITQLASYRLQKGLDRVRRKDSFRAGPGRLARVGYTSRILAALFSLTLLARGRVPGDTAAAAALNYARMREEDERYPYYGRVVEEEGWLVLQYWFFYPFNNWRSGFFGLNDHEGDWEMVTLYLYPNEAGDWQPEWVAYATHDFEGDDQRRRWDDPEVERAGEHAVVYAGAGSHASYYRPGEYLAELVLPILSPLVSLAKRVGMLWRRLLGEELAPPEKGLEHLFDVPFVDYARGDGLSIGPGEEKAWEEPQVISEAEGWVGEFRGLWGLWARDPVMGENAPGGPMYDRFGAVRKAWHDPVGWAGLSKETPPHKALDKARRRAHSIEERQRALRISVAEKSRELRDLGLEAEAMRGQAHMKLQYQAHQAKIAALSTELAESRARLAEDAALLRAVEGYAEQLRRGHRGAQRAHIRRARLPASPVSLRLGRIAEAWAAASIGLALFAFVAIVLFARDYLALGTGIIVAVIALVEAAFRRRLNQFIGVITGLLAFLASAVLLFVFFWDIVIAVVILAGAYILWENLRELWS
ncbi:MAG: hypothetical protein DWG76_07620 [Chloroflexi bacterium]|nr:hypothetical protein [Chloroflexota bacterium]MQC27294.1 hypothetical protein [Chloroflexota bacterium]